MRGVGQAGTRSTLGTLYEFWTLDPLLELGSRAALLAVHEPRRFRSVSTGTLDRLARVRYRTGTDLDFLSGEQRAQLVTPILGESDGMTHADGTDPMARATASIRARAADFVNRQSNTGEGQLRVAFRDSLTSLQSVMKSLSGTTLTHVTTLLKNNFNQIMPIYRDAPFAATIGMKPAPKDPWPRELDLDSDGAALVAHIARETGFANGWLSEDRIVALQRTASLGALMLDHVEHNQALLTNDDETDLGMSVAYRWRMALEDLVRSETAVNVPATSLRV